MDGATKFVCLLSSRKATANREIKHHVYGKHERQKCHVIMSFPPFFTFAVFNAKRPVLVFVNNASNILFNSYKACFGVYPIFKRVYTKPKNKCSILKRQTANGRLTFAVCRKRDAFKIFLLLLWRIRQCSFEPEESSKMISFDAGSSRARGSTSLFLQLLNASLSHFLQATTNGILQNTFQSRIIADKEKRSEHVDTILPSFMNKAVSIKRECPLPMKF